MTETMNITEMIDKLVNTHNASDEELKMVINCRDKADLSYLYSQADQVRKKYYGADVYVRGLIELSNYCRNDCFYCGIRRSNKNLSRYRLSKEDILSCCEVGYELGFRTFVMQGGEDGFYTDEFVCDIVSTIKHRYSDCAVTLSLGEKPYDSYLAYYRSGADRYLLRHETSNSEHYEKLHPAGMSLSARKQCLKDLKSIGYQVGSGFMVGSPYQTSENLIEDLRFLQELKPDMIGIGPFLPHEDTPFGTFPKGDLTLCLTMVSILRLLFPYSLLPATTALGTLDPKGRELGIQAGANVVMPNLSPKDVRKLYSLYNNKISTNEEAAEGRNKLEKSIESIGYRVVTARGDVFGR